MFEKIKIFKKLKEKDESKYKEVIFFTRLSTLSVLSAIIVVFLLFHYSGLEFNKDKKELSMRLAKAEDLPTRTILREFPKENKIVRKGRGENESFIVYEGGFCYEVVLSNDNHEIVYQERIK
ncbi:hypothetical protein QJV45_14215 [Listeria booriae]|uniref:hypothetical protein n=1 Tax=Listeria booriae TaxID=1552123 RepID=UPI002880B05A|nr:hypothetical protein [Listeria booriae]MDT0111634.1 hypothetical protein [Listeria booriae]